MSLMQCPELETFTVRPPAGIVCMRRYVKKEIANVIDAELYLDTIFGNSPGSSHVAPFLIRASISETFLQISIAASLTASWLARFIRDGRIDLAISLVTELTVDSLRDLGVGSPGLIVARSKVLFCFVSYGLLADSCDDNYHGQLQS